MAGLELEGPSVASIFVLGQRGDLGMDKLYKNPAKPGINKQPPLKGLDWSSTKKTAVSRVYGS